MIGQNNKSTAAQDKPATLTPPQSRVLKALSRSETWIRRKSLERIARKPDVLQIILDLRIKATGPEGIKLVGEYAIDQDGKPFARTLVALTCIGRQRAREVLKTTRRDLIPSAIPQKELQRGVAASPVVAPEPLTPRAGRSVDLSDSEHQAAQDLPGPRAKNANPRGLARTVRTLYSAALHVFRRVAGKALGVLK